MYRGKHRDKQNGNIYMWIKEYNTRAISTNKFDLFIIGLFKYVSVTTISNEQMIVNNELLSVCKDVLWSNVGRNYKNLSLNTWHPCQDLKMGPAAHDKGVTNDRNIQWDCPDNEKVSQHHSNETAA